MTDLEELFTNNKQWAEQQKSGDPDYFLRLAAQQNPKYLWIGCSDSRVSADVILGLMPGEVFVHRNIANLVIHTDLNCLSVIQFAVEALRVEHIIVCGHYGCGGIRAAMEDQDHGLIDNWLQHIKDVRRHHASEVSLLHTENDQLNLVCELNVRQQVTNVCHSTIVQNAWQQGQELAVHGLIYSIENGILKQICEPIVAANSLKP